MYDISRLRVKMNLIETGSDVSETRVVQDSVCGKRAA
jgi:hypothetical protein